MWGDPRAWDTRKRLHVLRVGDIGMIRDVFLRHDFCLYCIVKTFEGIPGGSTGGGGT